MSRAKPAATAMQVENVTQQADGSAWTALVRVRGALFVAAYVAGRLTVQLCPYKNAPKRPRWAPEAVQTWAAAQVAALPADWHALHRAMYG